MRGIHSRQSADIWPRHIIYTILTLVVVFVPFSNARADFTVRQSFVSTLQNQAGSIRVSGNIILSACSLGIRGEVRYDRRFGDYPSHYVTIIRFDQRQIWLVKPEKKRLHWIDYGMVRKRLRKHNRATGDYLNFMATRETADTSDSTAVDTAKDHTTAHWWSIDTLPSKVLLGDTCSTFNKTFDMRFDSKEVDSFSVRWVVDVSNNRALKDTLLAYVSRLEDTVFGATCINCYLADLSDTTMSAGIDSELYGLMTLLVSNQLGEVNVRYCADLAEELFDHASSNDNQHEALARLLNKKMTSCCLEGYDFAELSRKLFEKPKGYERRQATNEEISRAISLIIP